MVGTSSFRLLSLRQLMKFLRRQAHSTLQLGHQLLVLGWGDVLHVHYWLSILLFNIITHKLNTPYNKMQQNEGQEELKFQTSLNEYLAGKGEKDRGTLDFNQFQLYKLICRRGGCQSVSNRKEWEKIAEELKVKDGLKLRKHYLRYLLAFERKNYFGIEEEEDDDDRLLVNCNPRKMTKTEGNKQQPKPRDQNFSLESQIAKNMEQDIKQKDLCYLNKSKLSHSKAENKRIILGFQSFMDRRSAIYSLNMLLLYSVNSHFPFLFENNEKIFQAISSYAHSIYPPENEDQREHLRTVIAIFRNLTMNPINLKYILGTPIFQLFIKIFNTRFDPQCSKNIVDIMTGLVKVGWDCNQIISEIEECVLDDKVEEVESSLDLLRGLMDEKDENMITYVRDRVNVFLKIIMSSEMTVQVKEQALQILSFVTDVNAEARILFSKNSQLLTILIGILQHMRNQQKLSQFAALTLSNISTTPGAKYQLSFFETELMLIGFTDDSLAGIIANILADVANV